VIVFMVRPEGFEPPTLWFVAKCSIQLSYGRTLRVLQPFKDIGIRPPKQATNSRSMSYLLINKRVLKVMVRPERFELPTLWFEAKCSIQLSYGRSKQEGNYRSTLKIANKSLFDN
jgi:hypothetical protein